MFGKSEEKLPQVGHLVRVQAISSTTERPSYMSDSDLPVRPSFFKRLVRQLRQQMPAWTLGCVTICGLTAWLGATSLANANEPTPANILTAPTAAERLTQDNALKSVRVGMVPERLPGHTTAARMRQQQNAEEVPASPVVRGLMIDGVEIGVRPLMSSRIDIAPKVEGENRQLPEDYSKPIFANQPPLHDIPSPYHQRYTALASATAADFCYRPLYFEEVNLERYGRTHGLIQPVLSGARFVATVPALPYLMGTYHPTECYYWSHPYEAGRSAPRERELPPFNLEGGIAEAAVLTGLIFLFP